MTSDDRRRSDAAYVLRTVLDASDDAIVGKDLGGTILIWNRGAERTYGYSREEAIGKPISLIVPPDRRSELDDLMRRVGAGEHIGPIDTVRVTRNGLRLTVTLTLAPVTDDDGHIVAIIAIGRDVTASRRVGQQLEAAETQWRSIVESAVDSIIVIDSRGRIETFNGAAERLFGYRAAEVRGRNVSLLMPPRYAREHDGYIHRYLATGEPRIIGIGREVEGQRKDGTVFPMHLSVAEMHVDGVTKFTGIIRDLTERNVLETRLRDESALARLGQLAAVLAHEVRNPLAAVGGAVQMLIDHASLDPDHRAVAEEILRRLDGLNLLMNDLLRYARPPQPKLGEVDPTSLAETLAFFFRADPQWQAVEVAVEGQAGTVRADADLLKIALQNLLINAVQAMNGRGHVLIRLTRTDHWVHIDVIDRGPGIPVAVRDSLFTPFVTTKTRGTGLGLPTVVRLAQAHGGGVHVVSTGPEGTTIRLALPIGGPPASLA